MRVTNVATGAWAQALKGFSNRNAGRRTWLEVDDPRFGSQVQGHEYQLLGVTYDPKDERIQIMLGTFGGIGPHLTHTIGGVVGLDMLTDDQGRDVILRIAQQDAQTRLRIERFGDSTVSSAERPS